MVVSPEHVPVGELRDWQNGVTPPAGARGMSSTPTSSVTFPVFPTVNV